MSKSLENIEISILDIYVNHPELAREDLASAGYDVNALVDDGLALIKQHQFKQQVAFNKNHIQNLIVKAKELLMEKIKISKEEALNLLAQYQVKVQYRNISTFSEDELNQILKDVDLVKLIEDLEKNK